MSISYGVPPLEGVKQDRGV